MVSSEGQVRLAPRWAVVAMVASTLLLVVAGAVLAPSSSGADRWIAVGLALAGLCGLVFVAHGFWPRTPRPLRPSADGTVTIKAPALQVAAALLAWLVMWVVSGLIVFVVASRGMNAVESPGAAVAIIGATLASIPDTIRLLTGRLHRWRLSWGPGGVVYRGFRTSLDVPPGRLKHVGLQASRLFRWSGVPPRLRPREGGPRGYGVLLAPRGAEAVVLVPQILFREPAEQVAEELRAAAR